MSAASDADFIEQVISFADDLLKPCATGGSECRDQKQDLYKEAAKIGLLGIEVPKEKDGLGFTFGIKAQACEFLAAVDFGFAMSLVNTHNVGLRLVNSASDELRNEYLPRILAGEISACTAITEPSAGTDVAAMKTRATKTTEGWVLSGEKTWIVNGRDAGLSIVYAQCAEQTRAEYIGAFLVDLEHSGVTRYPIDTEFSQTSLRTGGFTIDKVTLGDNALLLAPGTAFKEILVEINGARIYVAAMCLGMLKRALNEASRYGRQRSSFGRTLYETPEWKQILDNVEVELVSLRNSVASAIVQYENGQDTQLIAAQAKIDAVEFCQRHIPQLLHAMGAEGLKPKYCFSRHLAATQIAGLTDGANSMLRERVKKLAAAQNMSSKKKEE